MSYGYNRQQLAALARGENPDAPTDPRDQAIADLRSENEKLKHRVRVLEYERDAAVSDKAQVVRRYAAQEQPRRDMVKRLWALYDRKRKTLPMQALRDALDPPADAVEEC